MKLLLLLLFAPFALISQENIFLGDMVTNLANGSDIFEFNNDECMISIESIPLPPGDYDFSITSDSDLESCDYMLSAIYENGETEFLGYIHAQSDNILEISLSDANGNFCEEDNIVFSFLGGGSATFQVNYTQTLCVEEMDEEEIESLGIPTMGQWGLICLSLLLIIIPIVNIKQFQFNLSNKQIIDSQ